MPRRWHNLALDILLTATLYFRYGYETRKTSSLIAGEPQTIVCYVLSGLISRRAYEVGAIQYYTSCALARNCLKWLIAKYENEATDSS